MTRYLQCRNLHCNAATGFELEDLKVPGKNQVTCSKCGTEWAGTILKQCCGHVTVKFVAVKKGASAHGFTNIQIFRV